MSEQDRSPEEETRQDAAAAQSDADSEADASAARSVTRGTLIVLALIVASLLWYLLADRFTPYTSQARVQGYVVGVAPKVAGVVTQVWVGNNEEVQPGQRLFEIDPSQYRIALEQARASVESARRQVGAGGAAVVAAEASLQAAVAGEVRARKNLDRLQRLHDDDPGTISIRQLEGAQASWDQATASVDAARADIQRAIEQMGGEDEASNSILRTALATLARAELDLANTVVEAPSRGIITDLQADVGRYAGTGSPVMTLVAVHDVWVNAEFTENNLGHLRRGTPVELLFDSMPGEVFTGSIRSIGLGVSAGQAPAPGTLPTVNNSRDWLRQAQRMPVIIDFDTSDPALRRQLRMGGQVTVMAHTEGHGLLVALGRMFMRLQSLLAYAY